MNSHSSAKGKHGTGMRDSATAQGLSQDAVKLLKTQDAGYLRTVGERVRRQLEKVEEEVRVQEGFGSFLDGEGRQEQEQEDEEEEDEWGFDAAPAVKRARKVVFADDRDEQRVLKKGLEEEEEEEEEEDDSFGALQRKKTRKELEADKRALDDARRTRKMKKRAMEARQNKLQALQKQYQDISSAERALDLQRAKMSNSVGGVNKNGLKFKIKERKR